MSVNYLEMSNTFIHVQQWPVQWLSFLAPHPLIFHLSFGLDKTLTQLLYIELSLRVAKINELGDHQKFFSNYFDDLRII